jgi:ribose transport system ATP-binding protein
MVSSDGESLSPEDRDMGEIVARTPTGPSAASALLALHGVSKTFEGVTVLRDVSLDIRAGEVHGLVGENGSGKSTLVKILAGFHAPDRGSEIRVGGRRIGLPIRHPQRDGLAIVHQDLALVDTMSVADNVGISVGFDRRPYALIDRKREALSVRELASQFGLDIRPDRLVGDLSPAERAIVAVMRALRQTRHRVGNQLLILDEPTASLPKSESLTLLTVMRSLAERGFGVIFISHRMHEVLEVCDRISVLRAGRLVGTCDAVASSRQDIVRMMLGYDLGDFYPEKHTANDKPIALQVDRLSGASISSVSLTAHSGEILGVTGLAGMGQDDLPYLLAGGWRRTGGSATASGVRLSGTPRSARAAGVELVPGNRQRDGLWMAGTAAENLTLPFVRQHWRKSILRLRDERAFAMDQMSAFSVRPLNPDLHVSKFSGGNQQKLVIARALHLNPRVLLLHEPTQGVDPGAKKEILRLIRSAADAGTAVLVFSSDVEEVAQLCHRVLIMAFGLVDSTLGGTQVNEQAINSASQRAGRSTAARAGLE